jgi:Domain of unknown function (DUF5664)/Domain of unknown function (DUF4406)
MESTNPKDALGKLKPSLHLIPPVANVIESVVMALGAKKYGAFNWRGKTVAASVYVSAALRHLAAYMDGENGDAESGVSHLAHVRACMGILLDAEAQGMLVDDRPAEGKAGAYIAALTKTNDLQTGVKTPVETDTTNFTGTPNPLRRIDCETLVSIGGPKSVATGIAAGITYTGVLQKQHPAYIYVAGPMRGVKDLNFPAFDAARDMLVQKGYNVISPADIDRASGDTNEVDQAKFVFRDFFALYFISQVSRKQGGIYLLPGWTKSIGAAAEANLARWLGLRLLIDTYNGELTDLKLENA